MCLDVRKKCECKDNNVQFHLRDNVLLPEVIVNLFCPQCHGPASFDSQTMINDNGWIIEYDMVLARMSIIQRLMVGAEEITPEFIFDHGYACWQEMYPGEQKEIKEEKAGIVKLMKEDPKVYLTTIQNWNINRVEKLKTEGWRKVLRA